MFEVRHMTESENPILQTGKRPREEGEGETERSRGKKNQKKTMTRALCFGYLGTGYHGSQRQPGSDLPTIEGELEKAMIDLGILDERETTKWTRAARTDKGVHAVGNMVTVGVTEEIPIEKINEKLSNMEIFFSHKVTNRFDARLQCDKRRYEYLLPRSIIPENAIGKFSAAFSVFKGTHNFHNFTSGILPTDPQAMRFIISAEISDVNEDFFKVVLVGQSFLLNQIRKLVACALEHALDRITLDDIRKFLTPDFRKNLRMAPAEGLLLDRLFYEMYDEHKCNFKDVLPIAWSLTEAQTRIDRFKTHVVYPEIMTKLLPVMTSWIASLDD
jgi:tRNA pseudouridine38-40 synthase